MGSAVLAEARSRYEKHKYGKLPDKSSKHYRKAKRRKDFYMAVENVFSRDLKEFKRDWHFIVTDLPAKYNPEFQDHSSLIEDTKEEYPKPGKKRNLTYGGFYK